MKNRNGNERSYLVANSGGLRGKRGESERKKLGE